MPKRGTYSKGVAKRKQILDSALKVVAQNGFRGASVRQIAESVGLSQAGLLHYFESKEELFIEVLRARDEDNRERFVDEHALDPDQIQERLLALARRNTEVPGLVELFVQTAVDGADPDHPGHEFHVTRNRVSAEVGARAFAQMQQEGMVREGIDPETVVTLLQSLGYGLMIMWLQDRQRDIVEPLRAFFSLLEPAASEAPPGEGNETGHDSAEPDKEPDPPQ